MEGATILSVISMIINVIIIGVVSNFDGPDPERGVVCFISGIAGTASLIVALVCCKKADWR
jgi:hypothetical protein